jgi:hypothetical protein
MVCARELGDDLLILGGVYRKHDKTLGAMVFVCILNIFHLEAAWHAPSCPKIEKHDTAPQIVERHDFAIQVCKLEWGRLEIFSRLSDISAWSLSKKYPNASKNRYK